MADVILFSGQTSESFTAKSAFMVAMLGSTTQSIMVEMLPTQIPDSGGWIPAPVVGSTQSLSDWHRHLFVNAAKGFKFRLNAGDGNTIESTVTFYRGNATQSSWYFD